MNGGTEENFTAYKNRDAQSTTKWLKRNQLKNSNGAGNLLIKTDKDERFQPWNEKSEIQVTVSTKMVCRLFLKSKDFMNCYRHIKKTVLEKH